MGNKKSNFLKIWLMGLICLLFFAGAAEAQEYEFERIWPVLPWYFCFPCGIAVDTAGNVYVADTNNHRIQKFAPAP